MPLHKAYFVSEEDKIRRETIMRTMCDLSLNFAAMSEKLGINFEQHFASELATLAPFIADGLVKRTETGLEVTDAGRLFIRNIAMCFDNTLGAAKRAAALEDDLKLRCPQKLQVCYLCGRVIEDNSSNDHVPQNNSSPKN